MPNEEFKAMVIKTIIGLEKRVYDLTDKKNKKHNKKSCTCYK